jgi:NitT/TauT family transport system substrate-binding protein
MQITCRQNTCRAGLAIVAAAAALACVSAAQAQQHTVRVAVVRALTSTPLMIADQKGWFKEYGIKVEVSDIDTTALVPLAQNQFQVMEAGMTAGYFNALEKDFPITIASDRAATPILHKLLIRPDLKDQIRRIADLKGRTIAVNGTASVVNYELGKLLETVGLTIKDVELKVLPFPQMGVGLANKAVDAAVAIPPWAFQLVDQNIGAVLVDVDDHVKPTPLSIAVAFINTDWARQNRELARNFFVAYIRGVREYCQAYHNGPNRQDVIDIAVRTGVERRQELLYKYPWPSRDPNGRFNMASLLDIQSWYVKAGLTQQQFPPERIATNEYVDYAVQKLGPFTVENKDSTLPGCR